MLVRLPFYAAAALVAASLGGCSSPTAASPDGGTTLPPTALTADCRTPGSTNPSCSRDQTAKGVGSGVILANPAGGFVDVANNRVILAGYSKSGKGNVIAINLATLERTLISGTVEDPRTGTAVRGTGPDIAKTFDVEPLPDGQWMIYADDAFLKLDPATGNRTAFATNVVNGASVTGPCQMAGKTVLFMNEPDGPPSMAIATDGSVYFGSGGVNGGGPPFDNDEGILKLAPDGKCSVVSWTSDTAARQIGSGFAWKFSQGSVLIDGTSLLSLQTHDGIIVRIDPATGDRKLVSNWLDGASVGSGGAINAPYMARVDATTVWTRGKNLGSAQVHAVTEINLTTGDRTQFKWDSDGPLGSFESNGWVALHPSLPRVAIIVDASLSPRVLLFEPSTGNQVLIADNPL